MRLDPLVKIITYIIWCHIGLNIVCRCSCRNKSFWRSTHRSRRPGVASFLLFYIHILRRLRSYHTAYIWKWNALISNKILNINFEDFCSSMYLFIYYKYMNETSLFFSVDTGQRIHELSHLMKISFKFLLLIEKKPSSLLPQKQTNLRLLKSLMKGFFIWMCFLIRNETGGRRAASWTSFSSSLNVFFLFVLFWFFCISMFAGWWSHFVFSLSWLLGSAKAPQEKACLLLRPRRKWSSSLQRGTFTSV